MRAFLTIRDSFSFPHSFFLLSCNTPLETKTAIRETKVVLITVKFVTNGKVTVNTVFPLINYY